MKNWFIKNGSAMARLTRTAVELIASWMLANLPELLNLFTMTNQTKALVASLLTMVLTAIIGSISDKKSGTITFLNVTEEDNDGFSKEEL